MIIWTDQDTLEMDLLVAVACVAFASKDDTRPHLGVGIDHGAVCATDGHRLVRFETQAPDDAPMQGKAWPRKHVETLIKVARATKSDRITLRRADCIEAAFPPVRQVMPQYGLEPAGPVGVNPAYLADMKAVVKACGCNGVALASIKGEYDPIGFVADGREHKARVVIMPMRL